MAYIYRFKDIRGNVTYIGKTCRKLDDRMNEHFGGKGHLPNSCYNNVARVEYMTVKTDADALLVEVYLINKYRPLYNKQNKSNHIGQTINLNIEENWKTYRVFKNEVEKEELGNLKGCLASLGVIGFLLYAIFNFFMSIL